MKIALIIYLIIRVILNLFGPLSKKVNEEILTVKEALNKLVSPIHEGFSKDYHILTFEEIKSFLGLETVDKDDADKISISLSIKFDNS